MEEQGYFDCDNRLGGPPRGRTSATVPACGRRAWLEADHLRGWKRGHDPQRIVLLCSQHHRQRTRGYLRVTVDDAGVRRFFLHDGTYLGRAGAPRRADLAAGFVGTNSEADTEEFVCTSSAERSEGEFVCTNTSSRRASPERNPIVSDDHAAGSAVRDALMALVALELKPRHAWASLERALKEQPELAKADAGEIVRASLAYCRR